MATFEHHKHKDFIESALNIGWEISSGPWGYSEHNERTVILTKTLHDPEISFQLWLVDRNLGVQQWDEKTGSRKPTIYPDDMWETGAEAWATLPDNEGHFNLHPTLSDVLENGLCDEYWRNLSSICDSCHRMVSHLNHVAFANKICDDCLAEAQPKLEYPGWSD